MLELRRVEPTKPVFGDKLPGPDALAGLLGAEPESEEFRKLAASLAKFTADWDSLVAKRQAKQAAEAAASAAARPKAAARPAENAMEVDAGVPGCDDLPEVDDDEGWKSLGCDTAEDRKRVLRCLEKFPAYKAKKQKLDG